MPDQVRMGVVLLCTLVFILSSSALRVPGINNTYNLRQNESWHWDFVFHCNYRREDYGCLFKKEKLWIQSINSHRSHISFYLSMLGRQNKVLSNATSQITDKVEYLGTVTSLFSMLKRAERNWPVVVGIMSSLPGGINLYYNFSNFTKATREFRRHLPNIENLVTGYRALSRLQRVYDIPLTSVADVTSSDDSSFSALECLHAAKYFCFSGFFQQCQEWLDIAYEKNKNSSYSEIPKEDFIELYFISSCMNGNERIMKTIYRTLFEGNPTFKPSILFNEDYRNVIRYGCEWIRAFTDELETLYVQRNVKPVEFNENKRHIAWDIGEQDDPSLLELCNHQSVYTKTARLLKCRYVHYNNPYLKIGPFKLEEFHIDPPVLMFHGVISDSEIDKIVKYGKPRMARATVYLGNGTDKEVVDFRTNVHFYINDSSLTMAAVLSRRSAMMTDWNLKMADPIQIASYGPAGDFIPHYDAFLGDEVDGTYSTVMFYINDVAAGGHTIFPALNVSVAPLKGSAIAWLSRTPDGIADRASLHGGCPVLQGYKWVLNKWFQRATQDTPKCTNNNETSFKYYYL